MLFSSKIRFGALGVFVLRLWAGEAAECDCLTPAPAAATPSTLAPKPSGGETRTIMIDNNCSFDLDVGFTGGFAGSTPCAQNQADFNGRCFWDLVLPTDLLGAGQATTIQIDKGDDSPDNDVIWSGAMYGIQSPHIDAACPDDCGPGVGAAGTLTLAEFTMLTSNLTYYDVSLVHGANIPLQFGPSATKSSIDYRNGVAGGDCSWAFEPPQKYREYLIEVKEAHGSCSHDADCDSDQVCGASFGDDAPVYGTCGTLFGYTNAHQNCIEGSQGYPFDCELYDDLYGCSGRFTESGYSRRVTGSENVCGCTDYSELGLESSFPCINANPLWLDQAYPWIEYVKKGCPTAYEYPYSDSTSTFTSDSHVFNLVFCPGDSEQAFYA